jgi:signal transduction histidine kinase
MRRLVVGAVIAIFIVPVVIVATIEIAAREGRRAIADDVLSAAREAEHGDLVAVSHARGARIWIVDPAAQRVLADSNSQWQRHSELGMTSLTGDAGLLDPEDDRPPPWQREQVAIAVTRGEASNCEVIQDDALLLCQAAIRRDDGSVVLAERVAPRVASRLADVRTPLLGLAAIVLATGALLVGWLTRRLAREVDTLATALDGERQRQAVATADLAHELKSPLSRIRIALETGSTDPAVVEPARAAVLDVDRTVTALLEVARAEAGLRDDPRERVELAELVAAVVATRAVPPALTLNVRGGPVHLDGVPSAIARAVGQLVDNALAFATSRITIDIAVVLGQAELAVHDDGPGVAADLAPRLFRRFVSRRPGGTGLGLAFVRAVAEAHGGTAVLGPTPAGARFVVRFGRVHN